MNVKGQQRYYMYPSMGHELLNKGDFAESTVWGCNTNNLMQAHGGIINARCIALKDPNNGSHSNLMASKEYVFRSLYNLQWMHPGSVCVFAATYSHRTKPEMVSAGAGLEQKTWQSTDGYHVWRINVQFWWMLDSYSPSLIPSLSKSHRATHKTFTWWLWYSGSLNTSSPLGKLMESYPLISCSRNRRDVP